MRDPLIIGAGIQGATLALAALDRGVRPTVVDRGDRPSGASVNSYGIVHGGLRYLQTLDIARWSQSRRAQRWYIDRFPRHVRPLRCVMPLYSGTLRSPALFAIARGMDRALRLMLNRQVALPADGACDREAVLAAYPVPAAGLLGGAVWHDAKILDPHALLEDMLAEVDARGGTVLRSTEAIALDIRQGALAGLHVRGRLDGKARRIASSTIFDCRGALSGCPLQGQEKDVLPSAAMLAFNLLIDMPSPPGGDAYALSPRAGRGRSYFFRRTGSATLVGTFYRPAPGGASDEPTEHDIASALAQIRLCLPSVPVERRAVLAVYSGRLPDRDGSGERLSAADRHLRPGREGHHILLGGKLTTAPLLSEKVAARMWRLAPRLPVGGAQPGHA